jgi:hypothetical protein
LPSFDAVVGLIDQQPKLAACLPVAEIILFQRFACWSKDQHGLKLSIIHSPLPSFDAVVGLIDQQPKLAACLPVAEIILFQRFAYWSKDQHGLKW